MNSDPTSKSGSFATQARAAEIALMDQLTLAEFCELTGVGVGDYGIYRVGAEGVSLCASASLERLTYEQQNAILQYARRVELKFPCSPETFVLWYNATRGLPHPRAPRGSLGASDFPLAKGFLEQLKRHEGLSTTNTEQSVRSDDVAAAFRVKSDEKVNAKWWNSRLRHPSRYHLQIARAAIGGAKRQSRWYPVIVAGWLIEYEHLSREAVLRAMRDNFQAWDAELL